MGGRKERAWERGWGFRNHGARPCLHSNMAERLSLQLAFALIALIAAVFYSGKAQFVFNKINQIIHGKRGCSPIVSIGHVTLHYFGFRGRAEGIRLMMEDFEIPYAETNFSKAEWPAIKEKGIETGLFTFGQGGWWKMTSIHICKTTFHISKLLAKWNCKNLRKNQTEFRLNWLWNFWRNTFNMYFSVLFQWSIISFI